MALINSPECGKEDVLDNECDIKNKKTKTGLIIAIIIVVILAVIFIVKKQQDEQALINLSLLSSHIEDIQEYKSYAITEIDGKYYSHETGISSAISKISKRLSNLDSCVEYIDENYSKSKNVIDKEVWRMSKYSQETWEEYRYYLNRRYYIDSDLSNRERAEKIVTEYVEQKVN